MGVARPTPAWRRPEFLAVIIVGGAAGTWVRDSAERWWPTAAGHWPWTTFGINILGAPLLGVLLEALASAGPDVGWRRMLRLGCGTGFCGGFTTYSTFMVEAVLLIRDGHAVIAASYGLVTVVLGVVAAWAGIELARSRRGAT